MKKNKFKVLNWLANRFGYEITVTKKVTSKPKVETEDKNKVTLRDMTKKYLDGKILKSKKVEIKTEEKPVMTLADKLKECCKL